MSPIKDDESGDACVAPTGEFMVFRGFLLTFLLCAAPAFAQQMSPGAEALERVRKAFTGVNDFTADIVQEKQLAIMKKKLVSTGTVKFRKPDLFLMRLNPPHASRLLLRDSLIEMMTGEGRQQMPLPPEQGLRKWMALLEKPVTALPEGIEAKAERQGDGQVVTIQPGRGGQVKSFAVTLDDAGKIRRLKILETNGNSTLISFQKMKTNVGLTERDFRLD